MLTPLCNANIPRLEERFLREPLGDILFDNPLDTQVKSLATQKWQHAAPKL